MKVKFTNAFDKQTLRIRDKILLTRIGKIIQSVYDCHFITDVANVKPIVGYPGYYRIRFGDYRIGISIESDTVWFHFVGHRNENTYKKFP